MILGSGRKPQFPAHLRWVRPSTEEFMLLIVVLEKTLESPLDCRKIKPVNPKGNQPWIFIERTDVEAEAPKLWIPDAKSWLIGKDPDAEKDWRQKEKGEAEDEIVGWHHQLNGHEFEQTPGEWRTEEPGMLYSMGSQRGGHSLVTEKQQIYIENCLRKIIQYYLFCLVK